MGAVDGVCVVITAANAESTIARAVVSALQHRQVHEIIVVDDASRDDTGGAALRAGDDSGRVKLIRFDANRGPSAARNAAFAAASSPFVAILDADDYFLPGRFDGLADGDWDFLADNIDFVPEGSVREAAASPLVSARSRRLEFEEFVERNIPQRGKARAELGFLKPVIRRSAWAGLDLAYDERVRMGEDFVVYATALSRGARFLLLERCGYVAEVRADSLSGRHSTADLAALAKAVDELVEDMSRADAPPSRLRLLRRHLASVRQKVATRSLLDRKREVGALRAILEAAPRPLHLARSMGELIDARAQRRAGPAPLPPVRRLLQPEEFSDDRRIAAR